MTVTALVLRQHHHIQELLVRLTKSREARESLLNTLFEGTSRLFRLQTEVYEPAVEPLVGTSVRMRPEIHARARVALFRLATSAPESTVFSQSIDELRNVLRAHALHQSAFVRALDSGARGPGLVRACRATENEWRAPRDQASTVRFTGHA